MRSLTASRAYRKSATHRSIREQEADLFRQVNAALRSAQGVSGIRQTAALADNEVLWITIMDLMRDPENKLPPETKAGILSMGYIVRREVQTAVPDVPFLIGLNENMAAGLLGSPLHATPQES